VKIYTKTGDKGDTALFGGGRVRKDDPRVAAYGEVDELNSFIGAAMATAPPDFESSLLTRIQHDLFAIGGQLASPDPSKVAKALEKAVIADAQVQALQDAIDRADDELATIREFILPGGSPKASAFHVARTVCRRAERAIITLHRTQAVPALILAYLNRLSDLLFTLARLANKRAGVPDQTW
jgi:cob(I)alamin adenosyltransferase